MRNIYVCVVWRPMKHVVLWRLTQPWKQFRRSRVNFRMPRCRSLTANSNLFLEKLLVHSTTDCEVQLKHYTVDSKLLSEIISMKQLIYLCLLMLTQLEKCAQDLGSTSKTVGSSMAQLLTCAAQGNEHYTGRKSLLYTESRFEKHNLVLIKQFCLNNCIHCRIGKI